VGIIRATHSNRPEPISKLFLRDAAASLRDLALRAPDIANELRRFADDLDAEAERGIDLEKTTRQTDRPSG